MRTERAPVITMAPSLSRWRDSNPLPRPYQGRVQPGELHRQMSIARESNPPRPAWKAGAFAARPAMQNDSGSSWGMPAPAFALSREERGASARWLSPHAQASRHRSCRPVRRARPLDAGGSLSVLTRGHLLPLRADDGTRTRNLFHGKEAIYQLMYVRRWKVAANRCSCCMR